MGDVTEFVNMVGGGDLAVDGKRASERCPG